ncbi:MAG: ABC transporter ATP-binding protein [Acidimicrobiia bacterium]|nr:ABC transporter ATP-binding protein [Acidimicrobiia bacterium]
MTNVIEIEGLRKTYRRRTGTTVAVDGLDLAVPEGGVYGFLGPNGSGKTTTIRCLLGLARPTGGELHLLGRAVPGGLRAAVRRTGAIVESPALFPTMTARENLRLLASVDGIGRVRVDDVLDLVGLGGRADDLVKRYSLGMKQRLALASALLKDPELLILDEPANGLDPAGMREVRHLLRRLADDGRTVFVSSHILAEIESTCDRVAILSAGRCVSQGTVEEVVSTAGHRPSVVVKVADLDAGERVLSAAGLGVEQVDDALRVDASPESAGEVTRILAREEHWVTDLRPGRFSLEDVFLDLTAGPAADDHEHVVAPATARIEEVVA